MLPAPTRATRSGVIAGGPRHAILLSYNVKWLGESAAAAFRHHSGDRPSGLLWLGWASRTPATALQLLAQTWLIALLTARRSRSPAAPRSPALPLLLLPRGGVIADACDRRRLLLVCSSPARAATAARRRRSSRSGRVAVWDIYAWVGFASLVRVVARPAYKVLLTEVVPPAEARSAMALSSMTETGSMVVVTGLGAFFLSVAGLTAAFVANTLTYLVAAWALWHHRRIAARGATTRLYAGAALADLRAGFRYLRGHRAILSPLVLTFTFVLATSPLFTLLAAVVHEEGKGLVDLGLLAAATSAGTFLGAAYAGLRRAGDHEPMRMPSSGWSGRLRSARLRSSRSAGPPWRRSSASARSSAPRRSGTRAGSRRSATPRLIRGGCRRSRRWSSALAPPLAALWAGPVLDRYGKPRPRRRRCSARVVLLARSALVRGRHARRVSLRARPLMRCRRGGRRPRVNDGQTGDRARSAPPSFSRRPRAQPTRQHRLEHRLQLAETRAYEPASPGGSPRARAFRRSRATNGKPGSASRTAERRAGMRPVDARDTCERLGLDGQLEQLERDAGLGRLAEDAVGHRPRGARARTARPRRRRDEADVLQSSSSGTPSASARPPPRSCRRS